MFGFFKNKGQVKGIPTVKGTVITVTKREFVDECVKVFKEYDYIRNPKKLAAIIFDETYKKHPILSSAEAGDLGLNKRKRYNRDFIACFEPEFFKATDPSDFALRVRRIEKNTYGITPILLFREVNNSK